jgi:hypothetical protein
MTTDDPSHDEITEHARGLWQSRGQPEGQDTEIWLDAERELRARSARPPLPGNATLTDAALASGKNQRKRGGSRSESASQSGVN